MADHSTKIDIQKLLSYGADLIKLLENEEDISYLNHRVDGLRSRCREHHASVQSSIEGYKERIDTCKQKAEGAKAEVASDAEIYLLSKELDDELQQETLLQNELRAINNQIKDLDEQRRSIEERRQVLKKMEQDEMKEQMKLSMYASITNIIPDLKEQSKISARNSIISPLITDIVYKENRVVEKLELHSQAMSDFDACNAIWKVFSSSGRH